MVRYLKQRDSYSCGPVAVLNALKWAGIKATAEDLKVFKWIAICTSPHGCWPKHLHNLIKVKFGRRASAMKGKPTMTYIDKWLDAGNSIIMRYFWHDPERDKRIGHYVFIPGRTSKYYYICNNGHYLPTLTKVSRKTMNNYLRMQREGDTCCTWYIRK